MNPESRIAQLEQENTILRHRIMKLEKKVEALKKKLTYIKQICAYIITEADKVLAGHSPKGKWSFAKGAKKAAESVYPYC